MCVDGLPAAVVKLVELEVVEIEVSCVVVRSLHAFCNVEGGVAGRVS